MVSFLGACTVRGNCSPARTLPSQ